MASLLCEFPLVCVIILAANIASCGATQDDFTSLGNGFKILNQKEYAETFNSKVMLPKKAAVQCNFDNGWCGFRNGRVGDDFDWTLRSKATPSSQTGPARDISGKGSYVYIEASLPQRTGYTARLLTPLLPAGIYCLQFGFYAYGKDIGALNVFKDVSRRKRELLLNVQRNYGKKWLHVVGTVKHPSYFQIEFEGVRGDGYRGDIALDDIRITAGKCRITGTEECGFGYPGLMSALSNFPPFSAWPWIVSLSPSGQLQQPLCTGVQVSYDWVLTSKTCARTLTQLDITTFTGNSESRKVVKIKAHPSKMSETVLLQLNKPISKSETDNVCLPPSIDSSALGDSQMCYVLATAFSFSGKVFKESTVSILPENNCSSYLTSIQWEPHDMKHLLCVQPASRFKVDSVVTSEHDGYIVCKNKVLQTWTLHAIGSFSHNNITSKTLVFTQVSGVVDWIEKIVNISTLVSKPPAVAAPNPPIAQARGFQIFEQTKKKCLTFIPATRRFTYGTCNVYDILQRFEWSALNQILILKTNHCLMSGDSPHFYLGSVRCSRTKKSQRWTCVDNRIRNNFQQQSFISLVVDNKGSVRLNVDSERSGRFQVYGTDDNVCSGRKTVNGPFKCDFNRERLCGFEQHQSYTNPRSQFMWTVRKPSSSEIEADATESMQSSDRIFKILRRGYLGGITPVLISPWFHGQRCIQFYSYMYGGSHLTQINIYKYEDDRRQTLLRINPGMEPQWVLQRATLSPKQCGTYKVFIQAYLPYGGNTKVAIRDVQVLTGACELKKKEGKCQKGWTFFEGSCFHQYNFSTSWHQALALCRIVAANLPTDAVVSNLLPLGGSSWFGVRSCPNGRLYSTQAIQYNYKHALNVEATCLQIRNLTAQGSVFKLSSCDLKMPFVCQKDPEKTRNNCGATYPFDASGSDVMVTDRQWPWQVIIVMKRKCECGGTLVAPGYVVTSNLCVTKVSLEDIKIFIPSSRSVIHKITRVVHHPMFGFKSGDNDIAIIMFDSHFLSSFSIHFACVNTMTTLWKENRSSKSELLKDSRCLVLGWGTYKGSTTTCGPNNYRVHDVEILEKAQCEEFYGKGIMTERMLCARPRKGIRYCIGDTGGPLVCDIAGAWTLVGVTVWGAGCTKTRRLGIYTDIASMKPWMDEVTKPKRNNR